MGRGGYEVACQYKETKCQFGDCFRRHELSESSDDEGDPMDKPGSNIYICMVLEWPRQCHLSATVSGYHDARVSASLTHLLAGKRHTLYIKTFIYLHMKKKKKKPGCSTLAHVIPTDPP
jgi:hypothetical protein